MSNIDRTYNAAIIRGITPHAAVVITAACGTVADPFLP